MGTDEKPRTPREKYGEELRLRRIAAGLTQETLSEQVVCSPTLISHYEAGRRMPKPDDAQRIDIALKTDGFFVRWLADLDSKLAQYFTAVAELEREATEIRQYGAALIPGLLQTKAYSRAVFEAYRPNYCAEELDELIVSRAQRSQLLDQPSAPVVWTLLDEAALRRCVGGPSAMAEQLHKIADMADAGRLRLHVLTLASGAHALMESMLYLLSFEDAAPVAWVEGLRTGRLMDDPALVAACRTSYSLALSDAAPRRKSVELVRTIAEEHEHGQHQAHHR
ncbi:helix-turn-helix transcriptional regulator [Streptomyces sp. NBC_00264]|uniref:helix-turn-helix domain-containing protein n=1 Tax=unclassified Streptomyces TaxID=2593676 RepID=UPI002250CA6F|nr:MULTISPECIES: helix-turn-helix transcriptional regulator [unclassified Streptomyces]WSX01554.1 helix-turn-helix transcriptional regulator [Streptomyces sp. NBC_00987]MCX5100800.1 helix-turn-helix transcriptional regulator [Streptomyces sp. NBC_00439]MCX5160321.1 helix-turn-helix transcriptional regulator [Streptomyces sp. NBC_00305]MCX5218844.1 helix-turn-helix transcriptional regulator [Streptomyces sp. NBC_00264]WSC30140.1 helix-turn-helix transcriptional regulator [Streptomyces sp. NBC_0